MSWLTVALILALLVCVGFVLFAAAANYRAAWLYNQNRDADHARCMALLSYYVGQKFAASVIMAAAEDMSTVEAQSDFQRIANTTWALGGPSVPVLWLRERAETMITEAEESQ